VNTPALDFVTCKATRREILAELRKNGIRRWPEVAGRQIPVRVVARHRGCGEASVLAFARFIRELGGLVTVDIPPDWKTKPPGRLSKRKTPALQ